jgi:hypothetical protein
VSDETADEIVRSALKESISMAEYNRSCLLKKKKLPKHEKEDLKHLEEILNAMNIVLAYYSPAE